MPVHMLSPLAYRMVLCRNAINPFSQASYSSSAGFLYVPAPLVSVVQDTKGRQT